jgi:hypothetical protein
MATMKSTNPEFDAVGWLKKQGITPSPLGEQVICAIATLIGDGRHEFLDTYKTSLTKKYRTDWTSDSLIRITFGGDCLSGGSDKGASPILRLALLCNALKINLHVTGSSNGFLRLVFRRDTKMPPVGKDGKPIRDFYFSVEDLRAMALERFEYVGGVVQDMRYVPDCWKDL